MALQAQGRFQLKECWRSRKTDSILGTRFGVKRGQWEAGLEIVFWRGKVVEGPGDLLGGEQSRGQQCGHTARVLGRGAGCTTGPLHPSVLSPRFPESKNRLCQLLLLPQPGAHSNPISSSVGGLGRSL